eukprot:TRINITY_DN3109_c0_g1_i2.p1 TRINITY_DN3109_c0_g1~~TRINITY_DN3109_c0_g1_i2.p1  ORF type:complete len:399 (-),score=66.20 TRINITY_DN3109_c0_g1_i2:1570-2766(-)
MERRLLLLLWLTLPGLCAPTLRSQVVVLQEDGVVCGDGEIQGQEECDDGGTAQGDGCSSQCEVELGWECSGVPSSCSGVCGDARVASSTEKCDDGNTQDGDGCSGNCTLVEPGWRCGSDQSWEHRRHLTELLKQPTAFPGLAGGCEPMCGDKLVVGDEECDDGNSQPGDGCGPDCKIEQGWAVGHQGKCCHLIECGDGIPDSGEECDDGNQQSGDGCTHQCQVEWGFTCVLGPAGKSICKPVCGDGIRAGMERCDDGNTADGDGCSGACQHEPGWHCDQPVSGASKCVQTVCGDSVVMEPEQCDDGNLAPGDGCSDKCQVETGWRCQAAIALPHQIGQILQTVQGESSCDAICGDRVQVGKEECDDGNRRSADGCSSECLLESGWSCDNDGCHLTVVN